MKIIKIFVLILLSSHLISACSDEKETRAISGVVNFVLGEVKVNDRPVSTGDYLFYGDILKTGNSSACEFKVGNQNIFRIRSNTKATLYFIKIKNEARIELETGSLAAVVKNKKVWGKDLIINTPLLTAGVRGTSFFTRVENPQSTYFCTCNGTIHLKDKNGENSKKITFAHHGAVRYFFGEKGIHTEQAKLLYHNDRDMEELAGKIDVIIDWNKPSK
jgi:hypothetical protein